MSSKGFIIVGFDPAWAGDIGWCRLAHDGAGYTEYETGTISPPKIDKRTKKRLATGAVPWLPTVTGDGAKSHRAAGIKAGIKDVLVAASENKPSGADRFIIVYETSLTWLHGASKQNRKESPVTRNGIMTAAFAVCSLWIGIAEWMQCSPLPWRVDILPIGTQKARGRFGTSQIGLRYGAGRIREIAQLSGYKDASNSKLKAMVGLSVQDRLQSEPGLIHLAALPPTDHEADAAVFAFVRGDEVALEMRLGNG